MRAVVAWCLALAPSAAIACVGCEGVPDLTFASPDDATAPPPQPTEDATLPAVDSASGATTPEASGSSDDAPGPPLPQDASMPPPANDGAPPPATGCPNTPPPGVTCCGAVACKGNAQQCNCGECAYCATEGFCCPSTHPAPGFCATELSQCH
jgi:hypothetical protein